MLQSAKSELADLQVEQQREMEGLLEVGNSPLKLCLFTFIT